MANKKRASITKKQPALKEILRKLRRHLPELRKKYSVKSLGVFGSYVRGEQRKRSDLDILVTFSSDN